MTSSPEKRKAPKKPPVKKPKAITFKCDYCSKVYVQEAAFIRHNCEVKTRIINADTKSVQLGFWVYNRVLKLNYSTRKEQTYEQFAKSKVYGVFTRFGEYLLNINAINPPGFVEYLVHEKVRVDDWTKPSKYEAYIRNLNVRESPDAAIERNLLLMKEWSLNTGENWIDFFRKINTNQATLWIQSGRISPWVLFTASSAQDMFDRMSDEQLSIVHNYINPTFWKHRIKLHGDDVECIREILEEAGI
jgi:hypothetical protein